MDVQQALYNRAVSWLVLHLNDGRSHRPVNGRSQRADRKKDETW